MFTKSITNRSTESSSSSCADYSELTAKLKYEAGLAAIKKEVAAFNPEIIKSKAFEKFNDRLEYAEILAMNGQFISAYTELNETNQYLPELRNINARLRWTKALQTNTLKEFDPQKKELRLAQDSKTQATLPFDDNRTQTTATTAPIALKPKETMVEFSLKQRNPKEECIELLSKISLLLQGQEDEFPQDLFQQLAVVNKLFEMSKEARDYKKVQKDLWKISQDLDDLIKHNEEKQKKSMQILQQPKPKVQPQRNISARTKAQKKKVSQTLFGKTKQQEPKLALTTSNETASTLLLPYLTMGAIFAVATILCILLYCNESNAQQMTTKRLSY